MKRYVVAVMAALFVMVVAAPGALAADPKKQVVVTFTFDGGYKGQALAAEILADHNMSGTFYVNSGYIGYPAYMTLQELYGLNRGRHEVGGGSTLNNDLPKIDPEKAKAQICNDRATLDRLGFRVTSFAYPYGDESPGVRRIVQKCGYNSARDVSGLYVDRNSCSSCPLAESLPPGDSWRLRTAETGMSVPELTQRVLDTEENGGGWVPLVFNYVCVCPGKGETAITPTAFEEFVDWLDKQGYETQTVDQVVGGDYRDIVGKVSGRLVPGDQTPLTDGQIALSKVPAFTVAGVAITQSQIIATGLLVAISIVLTFRVASRGNRYGR